jgi:hypothetical protein
MVQRVLERRLLDVAGLVGGEGRGGAVTLISALRRSGEPEQKVRLRAVQPPAHGACCPCRTL